MNQILSNQIEIQNNAENKIKNASSRSSTSKFKILFWININPTNKIINNRTNFFFNLLLGILSPI